MVANIHAEANCGIADVAAVRAPRHAIPDLPAAGSGTPGYNMLAGRYDPRIQCLRYAEQQSSGNFPAALQRRSPPTAQLEHTRFTRGVSGSFVQHPEGWFHRDPGQAGSLRRTTGRHGADRCA